MSDDDIPTMEQCIDRCCYCITRDTPQDYPGLSPEYRRKLAKLQATLQAEYDARMAAADKAEVGAVRGLIVWTLAVAAVIVLCFAGVARAQPVVIDGDTLRLNGVTVRLQGIDAPELHQTCGGWQAGVEATAYLRAVLRERRVECFWRGQDRYGRTIGKCTADGADIQAEMVRQGMAWAYLRYSLDYLPQENAAKAEKIGMHGHGCARAWEWRKERK